MVKRREPDETSDLQYIDWLQEEDESARLAIIYSLKTELLAVCGERVHTFELFNPYRSAMTAQSVYNLTPGPAYDLRIGKDLSDKAVQAQVWQELAELKPRLVIGSPPCASFSTLQGLVKDSEKKREALRQGMAHLQFCVDVYKWQIQNNGWFLHEHSHSASSWKLPLMPCMYGQTVDGEPVLKPTRWTGSCDFILRHLGKRCSGDHQVQINLVMIRTTHRLES